MKKKYKVCEKRGYHDWSNTVDSTTESFKDMWLRAECNDCGAVWEGSGDWQTGEGDALEDG